jgi:hypothetical protein
MGLGRYPLISLAEARQRADKQRRMLADGVDPLAEKYSHCAAVAAERAKAMTFRQCADAYIASHRAGWRGGDSERQWRGSLRDYAHPVIAALPVQSIDVALVMRVLEPIWNAKPETASRVRGRMESVLDWATAKMIGDWPGALDLIQMAVHYSNPFLLSKLTKPPELRTGFGYDAYHLAITAIDFLVALEFFPNTAAGLSGENMGDHVEWLCGFAAAALRSAEEHRALYDFLAAPDGRGRGDRHQLLFRGAIGAVLPRLIELRGGGFTIEQKDEIVAILASVLFPEHEVDLATVGRHRQRKQRKRQRTTT